jgi:predicted deacylase
VYLSGALHGDEIIGVNSMYYFIEYMLMSDQSDPTTKHILDNFEIIVTPMTNAVGYFRDEREEMLSNEAYAKSGKKSYDPNRDFPYNQKRPQDCLNTVVGRIVY